MYCEKCSALFEDGSTACPVCGGKKLRPPTADDYCFLVEKDPMWGGMLADVLTQKGVPFLDKRNMGAGFALKVGPQRERYRFYVPYSQLPAAQSVVEELFTPVADE